MAYADADDFTQRMGEQHLPDDDTALDEQLEAASRLIEKEMGLAPRYFEAHNATYFFEAHGQETLFLRASGLAYCLRSVADDGIRPDYAWSGDYDTPDKWDLDDAWVWPRPRNYSEISEPITSLELRNIGSAPRVRWPYPPGSVRIEGAWGWASTPEAVVDLVCKVVRDMRDTEAAGASGRFELFDATVMVRSDTWRLWNSIRQQYGGANYSLRGLGV